MSKKRNRKNIWRKKAYLTGVRIRSLIKSLIKFSIVFLLFYILFYIIYFFLKAKRMI